MTVRADVRLGHPRNLGSCGGALVPRVSRPQNAIVGGEERRVRDEIVRLSHRGLDVESFFREAGERIRRVVPFDGCCWLTLDPATLLPTSHIAQDSIRDEDVPRLAQNEYLQEDFNKFAGLARAPSVSGILREAAGGEPERSSRYRNLLVPNGFGAELRTAFVQREACWGGAAMYRKGGTPEYRSDEASFLAAAAGALAEGVRRAILLAAIPTEEAPDGPGLILLGPDNCVEAITPAADGLLSELLSVRGDEQLPSIVYAVASRARLIGRGGDATAGLARARIQTVSGRWLVLHGSLLDGTDERAAVIVEPPRAPELAPLIAAAYGLTERESEIGRLVLTGSSTKEIGKALHLSPYTVQDHLKAIFDKVGVRSRGELVAQLFFTHYAPHLGRGENLRTDGSLAVT